MEHFEGLFDKMRHRQSDKFRRPDRPWRLVESGSSPKHFKLHEQS